MMYKKVFDTHNEDSVSYGTAEDKLTAKGVVGSLVGTIAGGAALIIGLEYAIDKGPIYWLDQRDLKRIINNAYENKGSVEYSDIKDWNDSKFMESGILGINTKKMVAEELSEPTKEEVRTMVKDVYEDGSLSYGEKLKILDWQDANIWRKQDYNIDINAMIIDSIVRFRQTPNYTAFESDIFTVLNHKAGQPIDIEAVTNSTKN
ncbi:MAG: hypothetical protein HZB68_01115 [Candidatus Aenigmarchaeota archaeon]|nr:hypothetical protein [Candidatus Aenigmarchaeota archaeon]